MPSGRFPGAVLRGARARVALALGLAVAFLLVFFFVIQRSGGTEDAVAGTAPCQDSLQKAYDCYEDYLVGTLHEQGGQPALAELLRLSESNSYVLAKCHVLAHSIGRAAFEFYGSVAKANPHGDGTCWSGYFHGAMEKFLFGFTDEELRAALKTVCEPTPGEPYSFDYYNCVHGVGHGVTWRADNDIFRALPYCDELIGDWEQRSCYSGVFMQNIVTDGETHVSVNLKPDDPVYPCNAVDRRYKSACYLGQTSYILRTIGYDYAKGFEICDGVDADFVTTCYRSMGRDISGNFHQDPAKVVEHCSLGQPHLQGECYAGAAKNAVFNEHGVTMADALCAVVPARYGEDCVQARNEAAGVL